MSTNRAVTSREYKLMLNIGRFRERASGCEEFWKLVRFLAKRQSKTVGQLSIEDQNTEELREVCYLDTQGLAFHRNGFALRLRKEEAAEPDERFKLALKYRNSDRYASAAKDLKASVESGPGRKVKNKFEEDVIPPFVSKFSQSTSIQQAEAAKTETVRDVMKLFPGISELEIPEQLPVQKVSDFNAHEVFRKAGKIKFGGGPKVKCALSFWYLRSEHKGYPIVAEFSFDFDDDAEKFPIATVRGAGALFASVQKQSGWIDLASTTKTAYAYGAL